ncbi:MAG: hypothetical protein WC052_00090 [Patescibacteria group bacterium]
MPTVVKGDNEASRRMAVWAAAAVSMFLVVGGWAWSFQTSIPEASTTVDQPFAELNADLSTLFAETNGALNSQNISEQLDEASGNTSSVAIDPLVIEMLKEKVQAPTPTTTLPVQETKE